MSEYISNNDGNPSKSSRKYIVMLVIFGIIIIVQGVKIYLDHQERIANENQLASTEEELGSTMQQLSDIRDELNVKIEEIQALGGNVEELEQAKAEIEKELSDTKVRNRSALNRLQEKVSGYEVLLKAKDEEIKKLESLNEELLTENTSLKTEKNELSDSINTISKSKDALISKVAIASQLKAENIEVLAVNNRGRERESPFRVKQIEKLKVVFNIAENNVAPIQGKNVLIRIVDPSGQIIFDVDRGSGTFMLNNKEEFYTANQEILFDNSRQQLTFEYEKGSEYEEGSYLLEVYTDDYLMGRQEFIVK